MKQAADNYYDRSVFQLSWFWVATVVPVLTAGILLAGAAFTNDLVWDFSPSGLQFFWDTFQFPIWLAALAVPFGALIATNHRSLQTAHQLRLQSDQNIFANYYRHREEFTKSAKTLIEDRDSGIDKSFLKYINLDALHLIVFDKLRDYGNRSPSEEFIGLIHEAVRKYLEDLEAILSGKDGRRYFSDTYLGIRLEAHLQITQNAYFDVAAAMRGSYDSGSNNDEFDLRSALGISKIVKDIYLTIVSAYEIEGGYLEESDEYIIKLNFAVAELSKLQSLYSHIHQRLDDLDKLMNGAVPERFDFGAVNNQAQPFRRIAKLPREQILAITKASKYRNVTFENMPKGQDG